MNENQKLLVREVLHSIANMPQSERDKAVDNEELIDLDKFNKLPFVKKAVKRLQQANISQGMLLRNGFVLASLMLRYDMEVTNEQH